MWARNSPRALVIAAALALAACKVGPDFVRPSPPAETAYVPAGMPAAAMDGAGQTQRIDPGAPVTSDWWRLFGSRELDAWVREGLMANPGLDAAQASLRQSQDELRAGYGVFFPQVGVGLAASRQRSLPARNGLSGAGSVFSLFTLGATIDYALDVFGGQRRAVEGLAAQRDYQRYALLAAELALAGNLANTALARAGYAEQIEVTEELAGLQRDQLAITQARAKAGTTPESQVWAVRAALATTEATLPGLRQRRDQADHLLAALLGRAPARGPVPAFHLSSVRLPDELPLSLPSALVRQRPDVLAAEAQLHGATAQVGVATAALFPRFSLSGSYGGGSSAFGSLDAARNRFWSADAEADWPVFQGGSAWFGRKAAIEGQRRALALYRQTVLAAFAQVADALTALEHDAQVVQAQQEAVHAAGESLALVQANYRAGVAGYLDVLNADLQYHQARLASVQGQAQRYQDTVALYIALGGGWWNAPDVAPLAKERR
jgi:NodT family efflux transporter outer membrane factor (OMF) lipoprotein